MKNKSITFKLFIITTGFFLILLTATFFLQSAFFERFYISRKTKALEKNVAVFNATYFSSLNMSSKDLQSALLGMYKFEETNNAKIALWSSSGRVTLMTRTKEEQKDPAKSEVILNVINQWESLLSTNPNTPLPDNTQVYNIEHPYYHTNNLVIITPLIYEGKVEAIIFVAAPLQPVGEAASVIKEYYIYIYALALVLILILSLIYSKMISKPLIRLNRVATNMAELDFSEKCPVTGEDEIGNLSKALNFLSEKLNSTLSELKAANHRLTEDLQKEKNLETLRKDFIAGVSHELKAPIALIEGYAEGLKDNIAHEEDRAFYLEVIMDETQKMNTLVNGMLELSRLEGGSEKLKLTNFDISDLLNQILRRFHQSFEKKSIQLENQVPEGPCYVKGDSFRIEQVLTNFISNALKNTEDGNIIRLFLREWDSYYAVEIENQGEPIEQEELSKIWIKFYKVDKSRSRDVGGTGLGLAISKNILELHKSRFGAVNTDIGVKFFFTLVKAK